jgi:hypothetical protein
MRLRLLCLWLVPLALAGCQQEKKPAESRTAQGEILPGSASDAMRPLDSVRSQPPLAPQEAASGKPGKAPSGRASRSEAPPGATEDAAPPGPGTAPSIAPDPAAAQ